MSFKCLIQKYEINQIITFEYFFISDLDECELEIDDCHADATCIDSYGSWTCHCNVGFEGNGTHCYGKETFLNKLRTMTIDIFYD